MRAALRPLWPALTARFGIRPTDLEHLSGFEVAEYVNTLLDAAWNNKK